LVLILKIECQRSGIRVCLSSRCPILIPRRQVPGSCRLPGPSPISDYCTTTRVPTLTRS
jgi:hypothetical protein